ncbi:septation protein SepH [Curtobacterium sp. S6]|uniref:septation protein SepH n=1 Tax=Curtobacterium sp. S6 TaxID=1479623 RepID=UPI0004AAEE31|nr:septation protein SepH [Curtobacterium sp. S6]
MDRLTFVGVQDDGEHLVLESADDGHRYHVRIDNALRNAVVKARRAQTPRGLSGRGEYGPRDIQTRFRQGASVDEIVAESGWKPERVRRYEWPILAERAHIVTAAQSVTVRQLGHRSPGRRSLHDQVVAVREDWNFAEGDAQWNSWQREDGQWNVTVSVDYSQSALAQIPSGADFPARFVYNPANQTVTAGNAVAEFLFGKNVADPVSDPWDAGGEPDEDPVEGLTEETEPLEASGEETIQALDEPGDESSLETNTAADAAEAADSEAATTRRRDHLRAVSDESTSTEALLDELEARRGTRAGSDPESDRRVADLAEELPQAEPSAETSQEDTDEPTLDIEGVEENPAEKSDSSKANTSRSRGSRPSIPSWDDIVFGQQRPKN